MLPTLKSRCLNFKVFLTKDQSIRIVNQLLNDDINTVINDKLFDYYATPGKLFKLIKLSEEYDLDLINFDLNTAITTIFKPYNRFILLALLLKAAIVIAGVSSI